VGRARGNIRLLLRQKCLEVRKSIDKGLRDDSLLAVYNKENLWLQIKPGIFSKGDDSIVDSIQWTVGKTGDFKKDDKIVFVNVKRKIAPEPKTLDEARGMITADYQSYLEKEWIDSLRKKYPYKVNPRWCITIH
jgi:peptidyl-prolyl cis-trans isomerase SurA